MEGACFVGSLIMLLLCEARINFAKIKEGSAIKLQAELRVCKIFYSLNDAINSIRLDGGRSLENWAMIAVRRKRECRNKK